MSTQPKARAEGAWNPGIKSQIPWELRPLCTIFRPEYISNSLAEVDELRALTGLPHSELVVLRAERLLLHELLIRVTADFAVPSGSSIGDLGINFREIASRLLTRDLRPEMPAISAAYSQARGRLAEAVRVALATVLPGIAPPALLRTRMIDRLMRRRATPGPVAARDWGPQEIRQCERLAETSTDELQRLVYRTLARILAALFNTHGRAWGTPELIATLATDMASNTYCSDAIGACIEPMLLRAAPLEGFERLPLQQHPVVINTKGPSAAGKSSLRPLQEKLAGEIGLRWSDFALISPDIWRKKLLDYGSLGAAYKYAGSFTADELQIVDAKLDRYMARKHARGEMTHLLIDRFRFDSFAPDSDEAGSNLLTRFGHRAYLFFVITPPAQLVERAWHRGLEFGRYKAVDDTLAHSVEAYTGIPKVFFTWVGHADKRIRFEFLDNSVPLGELPRTVAFGDNRTCNILDVSGILNIERYGKVNVNATSPQELYGSRVRIEAGYNCGFLRRCVEGFRQVNFADQATGRIYLRVESGRPVAVDRAALEAATSKPDTLEGLRSVLPGVFASEVAGIGTPALLRDEIHGTAAPETIGQWGSVAPGS
ncbi:MAG: hypothetical protein ACHQIL_06215 [Steroidobacterales bacterium]